MSGPAGIKAQWHLAEMAENEADPFGDVLYSVGVEIDLSASEEALAETVVTLLLREGRLANGGLRCELKDGGQECRTCPQATLDPEEKRSRLCRLGKDQSTVEARFNETRDARLASEALDVEELARKIDAASELVPSPDVLELLTQAGA